ncbi:CALD1 protein, partial [Pitta sordida]|nr:CALD1 protein [Pitta sordida]
RLSYQRNDDDDEEAARERRRRARQERLRQKEEGDLSGEVTEKSEVNAQNSVAEEETKRSTDDEAALLERLARREERRQKRLQEALERQKEFDPTITDGSLSLPSRRELNNVEENETTGKEEKAETHRGHYEIEETVTKSYQRDNRRQDGEEEEKKEEKDKEEIQKEKPKEVPIEENQVDVTAEKSTNKEEAVETRSLAIDTEEHKPENNTNSVLEETQSITDTVDKEKLRDEEKAEEEKKEAEEKERLKAEEEKRAAEEKQKAEEEKRAAEERAKAEEEKRAAEERERAKAEEEKRAAEEKQKAEEEKRAAEERAKAEEEKRAAEERAKAEEEKRAAEEKARLEAEKLKEKQKKEEHKIEDKQVKEKKVQEEKPQAAFLRKQEEEKDVRVEAKKEKLPEEKLQPTSRKDQVKDDKDKVPKLEMKSVWDRKKGTPEQKAQNGERELSVSKLKNTENAFGRGENKNEELEKLKEKQQEAAAELDELKKRREERRKILEEEEQKKKQEETERKVREEEGKRRMKEEIERRRAEAAEKRQKIPEDGVSEDKKPFKCFSPKGSSLKIEERTEFLNKSAQKSGMKPSQTTAVVSKIDSRLEQYTSAIEGTKASRTAKPAASDLHVPAEGVRNIKSMWEKGNVFSSPSGTGTPNKETAGLKVGVSNRISEWLTKTPESNKLSAPKPSDLKPGDVSGKRNLWEKQSFEKPAASSKVT